jgi:hypothetical protein
MKLLTGIAVSWVFAASAVQAQGFTGTIIGWTGNPGNL